MHTNPGHQKLRQHTQLRMPHSPVCLILEIQLTKHEICDYFRMYISKPLESSLVDTGNPISLESRLVDAGNPCSEVELVSARPLLQGRPHLQQMFRSD